MQILTYFSKSLESIYYFRMKVPTDLRSIFNRTELKKSLRTKNKTVALCRCRQYTVAAEQVFETIRLSYFKAELTVTSLTDQLHDLTALKQLDSPSTIRDLEKELWNEVFKAANSAASFNDSHPTSNSTPEPAHAQLYPPIPPVQQVSQRIPLSELSRLVHRGGHRPARTGYRERHQPERVPRHVNRRHRQNGTSG